VGSGRKGGSLELVERFQQAVSLVRWGRGKKIHRPVGDGVGKLKGNVEGEKNDPVPSRAHSCCTPGITS